MICAISQMPYIRTKGTKLLIRTLALTYKKPKANLFQIEVLPEQKTVDIRKYDMYNIS